MKKKKLTVFAAGVLIVFLAVPGHGADESAWGKCSLPSPFYVPYYTGSIYPTPQHAVYHDDFLPIDNVLILPGAGIAGDDPRIDVLRTRIRHMGGGSRVVATLESEPGDAVVIALGDTAPARDMTPPEREQGYLINRTEQSGRRIIVLKGHDSQGLLWAVTSLNQLMTEQDGRALVRLAEVRDYPEIPRRGFRDWSWHRNTWHELQDPDSQESDAEEEFHTIHEKAGENGEVMEEDDPVRVRTALVDAEARAWYILNAKMNYVVLGAFHGSSQNRGNWRNPPPDVFVDGIRRTGELLSPLGIEWFSGYNPCPRECPEDGPSIFSKNNAGIDTGRDSDFEIILRDARLLADAGGGFYLGFDDYRFWLLYEEWRRFGTAREADTWFLNRLYKALNAEYGSAKIIFCPPFYMGPRGSRGISRNYGEDRVKYLEKLGTIPDDIGIFWTGPQVGATRVTREDVEWITSLINRKPLFWQNMGTGTLLPRRPRWFYLGDKITWWEKVGYEGFFKDMNVYIPNTSMPERAILAMTLSDYLWNPAAYDAGRSMSQAIKMMMGVDAFEDIMALYNTLNYFNRYNVGGFDLGSEAILSAAANIVELRRMAAEVSEYRRRVLKKAPEIARWSNMSGFAGVPTRFVENLQDRSRMSRSGRHEVTEIIGVVDQILETAISETGVNPFKDVFIPPYAFSGGSNDRVPQPPEDPMSASGRHEIFSFLAERRPAAWHVVPEGKEASASLAANFFINDPRQNKEYTLSISGQKHDSAGDKEIKIIINESIIYKGPALFPTHDWGIHEIEINGNTLDRDNTINIVASDMAENVPSFLLNYAVLNVKSE